jgi:hypothetical protein
MGRSNPGPQLPFAANVHLKSSLPIFFLEEDDAHFEKVACLDSKIELGFHDMAILRNACDEIKRHPEVLIITSHPGCNADGERVPYRSVLLALFIFTCLF